MKSYYSIFNVFNLEIGCKLEQASVDDRMVNVIAHNNAKMLPTVCHILRIDTSEISFVDGNDSPSLRNGKLHLGIVVFGVHARFMRADGVNAIHAQALCNLIAEILIQVQLDFQFSPRALHSQAHHKRVHWLR